MTPSTPTAAAAAEPDRRRWIGLAVLALPCMIYSMDLTVLNLAIPTLAAELKPSAGQLLWMIDIYGFMVAGFLVTMGTLGDRIGRRRLLMIGAAAFGAASVVAAFSASAEMLIAMRAILGVAGATLSPATLSLITTLFTDERERSFAISMWVASFSAGAVIGPLVGGALIQYYWWGSVFLIAVPPMALLLLIGPRLLPEYKAPDAGRLDLLSALLSLSAILPVIYAIKRAAEGQADAVAAAGIVVGLAAGAAFVRRQRRLADPMIDLRLFDSRPFRAALMINLAGILFMFGTFVLFAQYLQLVAGLSPLAAGLWSLPSAIAFTAASFLTPSLATRIRPATLIAGGLVVAAIGFLWLAAAPGLLQVVLASVVFSIGFTPVVTLTTGLIVGSAPPERTGAASAMSETSAELGGALGVALIGALAAAIYRARMESALPGLAAPEARATLAGALSAAERLPAAEGKLLVEAARAAFLGGFHTAALLAIGGMILCAAIAWRTLGDVKPVGH